MSSYIVVFTPEAEQHLAELYRYIPEKSRADIAPIVTIVGSFTEGAIMKRSFVRDPLELAGWKFFRKACRFL